MTCAGCGRSAAEVKKLAKARAPGVDLVVCDICIAECAAAIADAPTRVPGKNRACSFCRNPEGNVAVLLVLGGELICDECVDSFRS